MRLVYGSTGRNSRVLACDRAGRTKILRQLVWSGRGHATRGGQITDLDARGDRLAWSEQRYSRTRIALSVVTARRDGRGLRRRAIGTWPLTRLAPDSPSVDVALGRGTTLAWAVAPLGAGSCRGGRAMAEPRPGATPRTLGTTDCRPALRAEDGGRTVSWERLTDDRGYADLVAIPRRDGCPVRARFREVARDADHITTRRTSGHLGGLSKGVVERVCLRSTGVDAVVTQTEDGPAYGSRQALAALAGRWALVGQDSFGREDCFGAAWVVDLVTGRRGLEASGVGCGRGPRPGEATAITADGAAAWVARGLTGEVLFAIEPPGGAAPFGPPILELERGPIGSVTGLEAVGGAIAWSRDGERRTRAFGPALDGPGR